jgi:cell division protein FtsW
VPSLTKARVIDAPKKVKPPKEKQPMDLPLLVLVFLLLVSGLIALFSASYATAYYNEGNSFAFISRQLLWAAVGVVFMLIISKIPYQIFHRLALPIMVLSIALLVVVLFMPPINGCRRWIFIGNVLNLQPSEIAKFAITIFFAQLIVVFGEEKMKTFRFGVLPFMITLGIVGALMVLEPHLSGTILIMCIGLAIMLVGGTRIKWFAILGGIVVAAVIVVIFTPDLIAYAKDRIDFWLHPENDPLGKGFQTLQSLYAIGSGGLLGLGLGNSRQKYMYLPESENDFVFAVWCEELGFVGGVFIILPFVLLIWRGFTIAFHARDKFGALLVIGIVSRVAVQTILNIGVVTNALPSTGISLPFFSYGGTALLVLLAEMGVVLSVSRLGYLEKR